MIDLHVTTVQQLITSAIGLSTLVQGLITLLIYIHWVKDLVQDGECAALSWAHRFIYLEEPGLSSITHS